MQKMYFAQNLLLLLLVTLALVNYTTQTLNTGLEKLIDRVFTQNKYNILVRPVNKTSGLTVVSLELKILQIDLDEKYQELVTTAWVETWEDSRLQWDPEEHDNLTEITLPVSKLWVPDIVIQNGVGHNEYLNEFKYFNPWISYTGIITWVPEVRLHTKCLINVQDFPFDNQCCEISFYSWAHTIKQMMILQFENKTTTNTTHLAQNSEWQVFHTCALNKIITTSADLDWAVNSYILHIKRHTAYYVYSLLMPGVVLSVLNIFLFLLPPDSGEKITLGVTILLAFFVNSLTVSNYTPESTSDLPVIGIYYVFNIGLVSISIGSAVLVLGLHFRGHNISRVPPWIRRLFRIENKTSPHLATNTAENDPNSQRNDFLVRNVDIPRCCHSCHCHHHHHHHHRHQHISTERIRSDSTSDDADDYACTCNNNSRKRQSSSTKCCYKSSKLAYYGTMSKTFKLIKHSLSRLENDAEYGKRLTAIGNEWKRVASRIDFFLFIMSVLAIVSVPSVLFGKFAFRESIYVTARRQCQCINA